MLTQGQAVAYPWQTEKGFGRTPLIGDRHGFMPPQLKTNKKQMKNIISNI